MIPESLKMGHWLSEEPLPFPTNPPGSRKPTKATRCTWEENFPKGDIQANTSGVWFGSLQGGAPTSYKWGYKL